MSAITRLIQAWINPFVGRRAGIAARLTWLIVATVVATNVITVVIASLYVQHQRNQMDAEFRSRELQNINADQASNPSARTFAPNPNKLDARVGAGLSVLRANGLAGSVGPLPQKPERRRSPRGYDGMPLVFLGSGIISVLLCMGLALMVARRISKPIEAVSSAAARMGAGDLSSRVSLVQHFHQAGFEISSLAEEFNGMAETLERLDRNRKDMIADIAHELRTPITVMRSRLEALEDGVFPLVPTEITRLQTQTGMLERLVNDLRTLSLADAGQLEWKTQPFDLLARTQLVVVGFERQASERGIRLEVSGPAASILSDPDRTSQVISNLVSNAIRHANSSVLVMLETVPDGIMLKVHDDGPGIPTESLERVFQRFYRADASRTRSSGGTGLGLSIVEALVRLQGGSVAAGNRVGGGAEFRVCWPRTLEV